MEHQTDPQYLKEAVYQDAADLDIRTFILEQHRSHPQRWYSWLFTQLCLPEDGRILELGAGPGDLWLKNWSQLAPGWQIFLSDLSSGMVQAAKRRIGRYQEKESRFHFHFAALATAVLPFPTHHFDAVLAFGLLDHLPQRKQTFGEIQRVLKPGGHFYASAGGRAHLQEMEALIRPLLPDANYGGDPDQFGLHNGAALLAPFFTNVHLELYQDDLVFREPEPILAYALSETAVREQLTKEKLAALKKQVEQELRHQGEIRVTLKKGIFSGYNPQSVRVGDAKR